MNNIIDQGTIKLNRSISPMMKKIDESNDKTNSFESMDDPEDYSFSSEDEPSKKSEPIRKKRGSKLQEILTSGIFNKGTIRRRSMNQKIVQKIIAKGK